MGGSYNVADGLVDVVIDLRGVGNRCVMFIVHGEKEDVGYKRRGR